ncbi:MAG: porin family protein [Chlorobium phaeobacteroides]|uniref:Surface antigen msp4 family protein n=1 Tax=Chlorobium phaeobacteroides (strain BS1) TaxID=331678 RepID=B3EN54_CHLPB|nr:porin family protein [Chlorobium phaeobacteroides]MBL6956786.1 porin family protein [Chlorobium phaeobacteroides]
MKKALSLLAAAVLIMGWSIPSYAGNPYASGNIGIVWFDNLNGVESDYENRDYSIDASLDSGISLTGAVGCDMGDTRVEAEIGYQTNDAVSAEVLDDNGILEDGPWEWGGDVSLTTFMFNGYYDIALMESGLEFFLTAGVGGAFYSFDDVGDINDDRYRGTTNGSTWAYQLGAGLALPVGDNLIVDARYRYFDTAEFTTEDDFDAFDDVAMNLDISSHSALVGLRYNF